MHTKYLRNHLNEIRHLESSSLTVSFHRTVIRKKQIGLQGSVSPILEKELAQREVGNILDNIKGTLKLETNRGANLSIAVDDFEKIEEQLFNLGNAFIQAAEGTIPNPNTFMDEYIEAGLDVNFQDPKRKMTALHYLAYHGDEEYAEKIMNTGKVNYLLDDVFHRLSFDMASGKYNNPENNNLRQILLQKAEEQITKEGYENWADWSGTEGTPRYEARQKFIKHFESLG